MAERAGLGLYALPDRIDPTRLDLVEEFMATPIGRHSTDLALLLGRMRSTVDHGPLLVVERTGAGGWTVLQAPAGRGDPLVALATYGSREDAERDAFRRRWYLHTGLRLEGGSDDDHPPVAPPAPMGILGYADPPSAPLGGAVRCHLSAPGPVTVEVVRLRPGQDRAAPGWPESEAVAGLAAEDHEGVVQPVSPGSYGVIELGEAAFALTAGLTLQATVALVVAPTTRQTILAWGDPWLAAGMALWVAPGPTGEVNVGVTVSDGTTISEVAVPFPSAPWEWVTLVARADPGDRLALRAVPVGGGEPVAATASLGALGPHRPWPQLVIGGVGSPDGVTGPQDVRDHFDGRIEQVALAGPGGISEQECARLATPGDGSRDADLTDRPDLTDRLVGWWDFSIDMGGWDICDRGPHGLGGTWHNLPRRAVTGSRWDGATEDWRRAPEQYAAVHLLTDAVEDCAWPTAYDAHLPDDVPSGFYAFAVTGGSERQLIPFFVRPAAATTRQALTLLVPTATYSAYANSRFWWEDPIQEAVSDRLVEIGPADRALIAEPELGLSNYDVHADGTDVCHVSTRRPNLFLRADNVHDEGYCSDLDLVAWLDQSGYAYDVVTDLDLHVDPGMLDGTRVLLTGTHPEYVSAVEWDAIDRWIASGGRVLYLGGNGFHTRVDFSVERPWIMENRRIDHWSGNWPTKAGEQHLATDGESGGYLARGGRTARRLLGVETVTMGFDESRPFIRTAEADTRAAFVFAGVEGDIVGDHGRLGGAVVGQEWDNSLGGDLPDDHLVLARTADHSIVPALFGAGRAPFHGEMTHRFDPSGGAAWAVGSMAWCAALADGPPEHNDVSRITANVIDRFLQPDAWGAPAGALEAGGSAPAPG